MSQETVFEFYYPLLLWMCGACSSTDVEVTYGSDGSASWMLCRSCGCEGEPDDPYAGLEYGS